MHQAAAQPGNPPAAPQHANSIAVSRADLPLCCPRPADKLWNMHPRVYLPIENTPDGTAVCPYCGAHYRLID